VVIHVRYDSITRFVNTSYGYITTRRTTVVSCVQPLFVNFIFC